MSNTSTDIEWKEIGGYNGKYLISNYGGVDSFKYKNRRSLIGSIDKDGYLFVQLCLNGKVKAYKIHRLVGMYFIDNPNNLPEINHKYGDKKNNYYRDLEWSTRRDNILHSLQTGLKPKTTERQRLAVIKTNALKKKPIFQYTIGGRFINVYSSLLEAAGSLIIDSGNISSCCLGKIKSAGGFIWSYSKL